ncbi:glutamate--cysteine ligase [Coxiella endosymbiont of Amblyomma sculptum]|uniref:glutamate--cysteine ligase n=1 Tax=Coxiella endosymbiont of Amblyomma sculptum TaxID=2487929 RepID=UPI00132F24C4|nr:glutamate--cysteine ligase [Coxiella endosymbiont of Amblyomma sculptum]QHG92222.1 glutamate--cysteine ligase [Coxiella endosymbiont of Amblyomma sculptum]
MSLNLRTASSKSFSSLKIIKECFLNRKIDIEKWFYRQWLQTPPLLYTSIDIRNSGFKLAPVDTNLFPSGFNNLHPSYMSFYTKAIQNTIAEICPGTADFLIIPENHSRNIYYFESLAVFLEILRNAKFEIRVGTFSLKTIQMDLPSGRRLRIEPLERKGDRMGVRDFFPRCIILNNDLSGHVPDIFQNLNQKIIPTPCLGWATRLKSKHSKIYKTVSEQFASLINIDPWLISVLFDQCSEINFLKKEGAECLVSRSESVLQSVKEKYVQYNITENPFLVVKADSGTYGIGVMMIQNPKILYHLNRKQRTQMSASKGGVPITKAIVQEGVYSFETAGEKNSVAEPVVYLFGRHVIGGFYRIHENRGTNENLNTPGMRFIPMKFCTASCSTNHFYVYNVIARLAALAAAREANRKFNKVE